jgi:tetratricopeptide (TPR) repeat protein
MTIRRWLPAAVLLPLLLGAGSSSSPPDVEALLRYGNEAFERGAYAEAAALYEKASERATNPGLVAFNLATAKYQLGRAGNASALSEAEQAYRCCLEAGNPRRAQALFGLGNCLLVRAAGSSLDPVALRGAIDRFGECLRDPKCVAALAADARHNRQRARLLLLQAPPPQDGPGEEPNSEEQPDEPPDSAQQPDDKRGNDPGADKNDKGGKAGAAKSGPEQPGGDSQGTQAPGQGALPPVSDRSEQAPLAQRDALEHLEQATRRILDEMKQYRRSRPRPAGPGVRDW